MLRTTWALLIASLLSLGDDPAAVPPPILDDLVILPLRVHVLSADGLPEIDCNLSDDDIRRIVGKVNAIWRPAGIFWGLESIVREPAAHQDRFRIRRQLSPDGFLPLGTYQSLIPTRGRIEHGLDVYYLHRFAVNGVYLGDRIALVQETARLREVPGGIDEPLPRVTAHELGHALGLPHRQDRTNLLASGTTGTGLNAKEIEKARVIADSMPGRLTYLELRNRAEIEDDPSRRSLYAAWLSELRDPDSRAIDRR